MKKQKISPHDRFFRGLMDNPKVAREFFEANLPDALKKEVDLSTLTLKKDSFIGDDLRLQVADLLFEVSIKKEKGYFYLLTEHQSTPQKLMPFRILKYMIAIQEQHLAKHKTKTLPFVYPLLLYGGKNKYPYSTDLFSLFGPHEEVARRVWTKPYQLIDLTQIPDEKLAPYLFFGTMAQIMKHIRDLDLLPFLRKSLALLKKIEETGEESYTVRSITYFIEAGNIPDGQKFIELVSRELATLKEEDVMTLAEQWEKKGIEKGIQQGMQQGMQQGVQQGMQQGMQQGAFEEKRQIALGMLQEKLPLSLISKVTGLSEKDLEGLTSHA
jgi:predicted transposase/invertase (TIGR01784 family)